VCSSAPDEGPGSVAALAADRRRSSTSLPLEHSRTDTDQAGRATCSPTLVSNRLQSDTGIISAIVIGAIIGALGRLVLPGRQPIPIWVTIVVGIVAAFTGTSIARAIGIPIATSGIDWLELIVQLVVAAIGVILVSKPLRTSFRTALTRVHPAGSTSLS
jgi:uncharacterized membrane protein YeaQ/YmgE (transglycosylase-associated protein family)